MPTTPAWEAARHGLPGDLNATNHAAQIGQFLGSHGITPVYQGSPVLTPNGKGGTAWVLHTDAVDIAQPFTLSGTTVGRVTIPVLPVGAGADLLVSLYTDNAGVPGNLVTQTMVPAAWINQLAAVKGVAGPSSSPPTTQYTGSALATAAFNTLQCGGWSSAAWALPSATSSSALTLAVPVISGSYLILAGALATGSTANAGNYTLPLSGGGAPGPLTPQPLLPGAINSGGATATSDTLVYVGGILNGAGTTLASVYAAGWNPASGTISAWSQQTSLPTAVSQPTAVANGQTVYVIGGFNSSSALVSTVYYTTVTNGQITSWSSGPNLPVPLGGPLAAFVLGGFLVISGGAGQSATSAATYYALINPDGSLGAWQTGPSTATGTNYPVAANAWGAVITGSLPGGVPTNDIFALTVTPNGLGGAWTRQTYPFSPALGANANFTAMYPIADGQWQMLVLFASSYSTTTVSLTPTISVPLPATSLTNGAQYHIVLQQLGGDLVDYLRVSDDYQTFSGNPTLLTRPRGTASWTPGTSGHAIPITVYDGSSTGTLVHTWEDPNANKLAAHTTTLLADSLGRLLGTCEATALPNDPLDSNPTFTTGTAPWTTTGCTLTQSNAQTQGGLPYSGLMTPSGSAGTAFILSEKVPVAPGQWYLANCWAYSPNGYNSVSLSVVWYDSAGNQVSTSNNSVTLAAATWTQLSNRFQAPAGAAQASLAPAEGGTPPATATLYLSNVTLTAAYPSALASVAEVTYSPGSSLPTGITQLV